MNKLLNGFVTTVALATAFGLGVITTVCVEAKWAAELVAAKKRREEKED